jgi:hypothetical protein
MKHAMPQHSSFAMLFDPALVRAVAERAAQWNLPRHVCRPLDRYAGSRVNADLAAFDAAVECAPVTEEEMRDEPACATSAPDADADADFEDGDDF